MDRLKRLANWLASVAARLTGASERDRRGSSSSQGLLEMPEDPNDIRSYRSTKDIVRSGRFTPKERAAEYRRRGKGPAGVIDGVYNDAHLEDGVYNDEDRDWKADA